MAKLSVLFSGSSANCTVLTGRFGTVLVDFGASVKRTKEELDRLGLSLEEVQGVFITHEHADHVYGLKTLTKQYSIPVISSPATLRFLEERDLVSQKAVLVPTEEANLDDLQIKRFSTSHDCVDPGGYRFTLPDGTSVAVCTDLGFVSEEVKTALAGCRCVLLESNHDLHMLNTGPYPPELKQRIASDHGHLSNAACGALLPELLKEGADRFILGHLSAHNNLPGLALNTAVASLMDCRAKKDKDYLLYTASPNGGETLFF